MENKCRISKRRIRLIDLLADDDLAKAFPVVAEDILLHLAGRAVDGESHLVIGQRIALRRLCLLEVIVVPVEVIDREPALCVVLSILLVIFMRIIHLRINAVVSDIRHKNRC